ncbi:hypothetical protein [Bdellovibrio reynosensis]|uniref:Uncharacterized protein n=1 Tax=Bdellovibrio reynosensis TaxID=2835041 RepID=A0ABY4C5U8_9BACT|nr:hypothetical protein [Bdellovibrio reynosensis]UOF00184.1 hypothetical protein MNR06_10770 [Bdellovibrio reynosensis]
MLRKWVVVLLLALSTTGCLEESGKSSEIVIPPGGLIQLDVSTVNKVSDNKYSLYLTEFVQADKKTKNLLDLTTDNKPSLIKQIMPKGLEPSGALVAKIVMEYRTTPWFALVYPEQIIKPTLETTLVYNLLSSYPDRDLATFTASEVSEILVEIEKFKSSRMALFGIDQNYNPDHLYRFLRNGLSNDASFLTFLKKFSLNYDFNTDGDVLSEPYPFGILNRAPILDDKSTTRVVQQRVQEEKVLEVKATARDPDGDQVFYAWMWDDALVDAKEGVARIKPSYEDGKADNYELSVLVSDGGKIARVDWPVFVENVNRRPVFSHSCTLSALENEEWTCSVSYSDPDGDGIKLKVDALTGSNPVYIDGQAAPVEITGKNQIQVRWTPNNEDARKKSNSIILELLDDNAGLTMATLAVSVSDSNKSPILLGGVNPIADAAVEFDYCALQSTDGLAPYQFYLDFQDPDNVADIPSNPPDQITFTTGGNLNSNISKVGDPVVLADRIRQTFMWKPTHALLKGTFIVSLRDNHGGVTPPISLSLTAENRNTKPCLVATDFLLSLNELNPNNKGNFSSSDRDGDPVWIEYYGFVSNNSLDALKHIEDCTAGQPITLKRNITMSEPTFRKNAATMCFRTHYNTETNAGGIAGYVKFSRLTEDTANRTIPKGFVLSSTVAENGYVMEFETMNAVTVEPGDLDIYVPVKGKNRTATVNNVNLITPALSDANLKVKNEANIDDRGLVTFYRTVAGGAVAIPRGTIVKTNNNPSIEFEVPTDFTFAAAAGASEMKVPVWRRTLNLTADKLLNLGAVIAGPAMTARTVSGLIDFNESKGNPGTAASTINKLLRIRGLDGYRAPANSITLFDAALPPEATTLKVTNTAIIVHEGKVRFTRTSSATSFTLPVGTVLRTANMTRYELAEALIMNAGETLKNIWVRRIDNLAQTTSTPYANSRVITVRFTDSNNPTRLISTPVIEASEGVNLTGGLIEVSDSSQAIPVPLLSLDEYWYPKDSVDYYSFDVVAQGTAPSGTYKFCREPGAFAAACTACNVNPPAVAWRFFFKSAKCYMRYVPHVNDYSGTFSFKMTIREHFAYGGSATSSTNLTLYVKEVNDTPIITDSAFNAYGGGVGTVHTNPIYVGEYSENTESFYSIYVKDTDKGGELKTVNFDLDSQVWDVKTSTWRPTPAGLKIDIEKRENLTASSGSKTTAKIVWKPTDADAKKFAGNDGFVIKVKVYDAKTMPDAQTFTYAYYKIKVINNNQVPTIGAIATDNKFTIYADTYFTKDFYLYDNDAYIPDAGTFATKLTLCRDSNSNTVLHPTLDGASADPFVCHATSAYWAEELTTFEPGYQKNMSITQCSSGGAVIADLAVPKLSAIGPTEVENGVLKQKYRLEWCPQRNHIGEFSAEIFVNDNGDTNRDGLALSRAVSATPLRFKIISPVFLESPRVNISNVPVHFMPHTSANMASNPFRYEVIANNSQKNPLEYTLLNSPRACGEANGMCIDAQKGIITWNPAYPGDITPVDGVGNLVRVKVRDTVTGDSDIAHFYLKVQNPLTPFEESPVISAVLPATTDVLVAEKELLNLSVTASDPNPNDTLFYRWYVNDELKSDEGSTYSFKPSDTDGSADPDGTGPLKVGEYKIRVEVTDGNFMTSRTWNIRIRNTYLLGETLFDIFTARPQSLPSQNPYELSWLAEVAHSTTLGTDSMDHLIFSGSYKIGVFVKHFLWDLLIVNGTVTKPNGSLSNPPWNFFEDLPWLSGTKTDRMAIVPTGTTFDVILTSQVPRAGPFGVTTEALRIPATDFTTLALSSGNKCTGDCPLQLYTSDASSDDRLTASMDSLYVFFANDARDKLYYDYLTPATPVLIRNFGTEKVSGMALNRAIDRLYVTTQQTAPSIAHKIYVFNVAPLRSGAAAVLLSSMPIYDGVPAHEDCKPTDIAIDPVTNRVIILLSGTGGVATFPDSGATTPVVGDIQFVGVNEISSSPFDVPGAGKRLVVKADDRLVIGTMRDSNQVFTIDLTNFNVYTNSVQDPVDSIIAYSSGQLVLVSRGKGRIFKAR